MEMKVVLASIGGYKDCVVGLGICTFGNFKRAYLLLFSSKKAEIWNIFGKILAIKMKFI